jgi:hypothetical protein
MYGAPMNNGAMGDRHVVADADRRFLIGAMNDGAILDIDFIANTDRMNVAPDHRVKPYAATVAHDDIANDNGVVGEETVFAQLRRDSFDRFYYCHIIEGL